MDPTQDWLLRMIFTLSQSLINRNSSQTEIPRPSNTIGDDDMLPEILKEMIRGGKLDEAENLLFRCVENFPLAENYAIGLQFYEDLANLDEEQLKKSGWDREDIREGLCDLHQLIFNEPLKLPEKE